MSWDIGCDHFRLSQFDSSEAITVRLSSNKPKDDPTYYWMQPGKVETKNGKLAWVYPKGTYKYLYKMKGEELFEAIKDLYNYVYQECKESKSVFQQKARIAGRIKLVNQLERVSKVRYPCTSTIWEDFEKYSLWTYEDFLAS